MSQSSRDTQPERKMDPYQVVRRPLITEKGTLQAERYDTYAFEVNAEATKQNIKEAVEKLFEVRVVCVRTQNRKGKSRRVRYQKGKTRRWKKALVQLHEEDKITFF